MINKQMIQAFYVFSDPWTIMILMLLEKGPIKNPELTEGLVFREPTETVNIHREALRSRLYLLEENHIVGKNKHIKSSERQEYSLTEKGKQCAAVLRETSCKLAEILAT